jgi:hypothetical protein
LDGIAPPKRPPAAGFSFFDGFGAGVADFAGEAALWAHNGAVMMEEINMNNASVFIPLAFP